MLSLVSLLSQDRHKGSQHRCVSARSQFLFPPELRQRHEQLSPQQGAAQPATTTTAAAGAAARGCRQYGNATQSVAIARPVTAAERCHTRHGLGNQSVNLLRLINSNIVVANETS